MRNRKLKKNLKRRQEDFNKMIKGPSDYKGYRRPGSNKKG